jgi:hypothetical protein
MSTTPNAPMPPPLPPNTAPDVTAPLWRDETTQASLQESALPVHVSMTVSDSAPPASHTMQAVTERQSAEAPQKETLRHAKPIPQPLPPALQPWRAWLQWFPHDSALAIGGLLPRLHAAMGQYRGTLQRGAHTPNGIDEIRSRGPYHRLLLSEWALADEAPDEFLRRASSGEHLFLSPRYETIKADAQIVAVFDAGPAQFGAPRLAHIALWILLARRAEQAGIGFRWGVLSVPGALDGGGDAQALKRLLAARSLQHPVATQLDAWRDALAADPCQGGERWLIAGRREATDGFSHRVGILRGLQAQLTVRIAGSAGTREVEVPLPPAKASTRLLRGAFAFEVATSDTLPTEEAIEISEKLSLRQPPLIGPNGSQIAVPILGESAAMIYPMTASSHEHGRGSKAQNSKRRPRKMRWSSGNDLLCAAMSRKQFGGIVADAHHLHFWQMEGLRVLQRPPKEQMQAPPGQAHWLPCLWFNSGARPHRVIVIDYAGRLLAFVGNKRSGDDVDLEKLDAHVLAIARADDEYFAYVRRDQNTVHLMLRQHRGFSSTSLAYATPPPSSKSLDKAFLHGRHRFAGGAWCVRTERGRGEDSASVWMIYPAARSEQVGQFVEGQPIQVPPGWQVVGLTPVPNTASEYGLVAIAANRKRLVLLCQAGNETLYASARSITAVSVATDCDLIALITEDRQLITLTPGGEQQRWNVENAQDDDD